MYRLTAGLGSVLGSALSVLGSVLVLGLVWLPPARLHSSDRVVIDELPVQPVDRLLSRSLRGDVVNVLRSQLLVLPTAQRHGASAVSSPPRSRQTVSRHQSTAQSFGFQQVGAERVSLLQPASASDLQQQFASIHPPCW